MSYQLGESGENLFVLQQLISIFVSQKGSTVEVLTSLYPFENFPNQTLKSFKVFVSSKGPYRCTTFLSKPHLALLLLISINVVSLAKANM